MSKRVAKIEIEWNQKHNTLHADVVVGGKVVFSSQPIPGDRTFSEARWSAADWARANGYTVK